MNIARRKSKIIKIGNVRIGGDYPVLIQSMAKTRTSDIEKTVKEINKLEHAGCEIVRLAVKDEQDAKAIKGIKQKVRLPIVCDIHFNWKLAMKAMENGADKIRLNPGNIFKKQEIKEIVSAAKTHHIPIRVGVNSGSVRRQGSPRHRISASPAEEMVESALDYVKILENLGLYDIVISLKASNILDTVECYRKIAKLCDYPLHLGVTATGAPFSGTIKSSIALGGLLLDGIGDTIRVSLTEKPVQEVYAAKIILESLELRRLSRPVIISCPTCGRCEVDLVKIVKELENKLSQVSGRMLHAQPKIAVMGCVVNGPGEAKDADIGVAFGKKQGLLFKGGRPIRKLTISNCVSVLLKEMEALNA